MPGYLVEVDGQAAEVRFAGLHTVVSRAVLSRLYGRETRIDNAFHRKHREEYLETASRNNLILAFGSGMDVHSFGTGLIMDKNPAEVTKDERQAGKTVTLGRMYGRGAKAIAAQYGVDEELMAARVRKWDSVFPEFGDWHKAAKSFVSEKGFVTSIFGLVRRIPDVFLDPDAHEDNGMWISKALREAINSPVQGDSHMWISHAIRWFHLNFLDKNKLIRAHIWNDVHDATLADTHPQDLDAVACAQAMSILHPYFDVDNYPWVCCDLATDLKLYEHSWGNKVAEIRFDTATGFFKDKARPGFNWKEAVRETWFSAKKKLVESGKLKNN